MIERHYPFLVVCSLPDGTVEYAEPYLTREEANHRAAEFSDLETAKATILVFGPDGAGEPFYSADDESYAMHGF